MFPDNLTRSEAQARSALIQTDAYAVTLDLTGGGLEAPEQIFRSTSTVTFRAREAGSLHVDLIAEAVEDATLDGAPLDPASFVDSRLPLEVAAGAHELTVVARCRYSRSGEGLHRFVDPRDSRVYLYSQFEAADARRTYACFEQPDLKARFTITVLAPAAWTVESNGADVEVTLVDGAKSPGLPTQRWAFAETAPISTYLTAVVAGEYHRIRRAAGGPRSDLPMSILCRQSQVEQLDADRIFATTAAGLEVFERHFGVGYPFGKYDQVFVPEYNSGAMENVGCVVLRDEFLFRSRVTAATYQTRDDTILHELSHMWFGNLVTMRWWDDLWLKESFATWASHFCVGETAEDPTATWASFGNDMKTWAYRQDQLPSTHPIAADMVDLEAAELNFDGITYAKGASVLVQLVAFVGRDAFLRGVREYFADYAYGNTELADLLRVLERASNRDLSHWSAQWLETAGVNTLRAELETAADGTLSGCTVIQTAPESWPTLRSHRIAIGLYERGPGGLTRIRRVGTDINGARTPVPELIGQRQPDLLLLNDDDLSYAKVRLDPASLATVVASIHELPTALSRSLCWGAAWDMCRDAELPAADYIALALRGVGIESDLNAVGAVLGQGHKAAADYSPPDQRAAVRQTWRDGLADLLVAAEPGSDHQLALARAVTITADPTTAPRLTGWLAGEELPPDLALDPELRWLVVHHLARLGELDAAQIEAERAQDPTITGAEQAAAALAARPTAAAKADAWRQAVDEDTLPNATQRGICRSFWARDQDAVLAPYVERYLTAAEDISAGRGVWATKGIAMRNHVLRDLFPQPTDLQGFQARLDAWFERVDLADSIQRIIVERRDDTLRAIRCQQASATSR
jgi:aminopeptidase N